MAEMLLSPSVVFAILIGFAGLVTFGVLARLLGGKEKNKSNAAETSKVTPEDSVIISYHFSKRLNAISDHGYFETPDSKPADLMLSYRFEFASKTFCGSSLMILSLISPRSSKLMCLSS